MLNNTAKTTIIAKKEHVFMKTKIIKKMLAIMIASATISATPGIASAMHNGIQFLGHKRHYSGGSEEESEEEAEEENNVIIEEEPDDQDVQNVNADRYEDFKNFICDAIEVGYDKKYGNTSENLNERVWNFLNELKKFVDDGADKKRVAEIVLKLIKTESFSKLYRYKLNRYCPECEFMVGVLDVLKKCQSDPNARPIVLKAVAGLGSQVDVDSTEIEQGIKQDTGAIKYIDYLQQMWIDQEKNLTEDKPEETRKLAKEAQELIMNECRASRTFTQEKKESFNQTLRQDIKQQNDLIMSSIIDILDYCCTQQDSQYKVVDLVKGDGEISFGSKLLKEKTVEILDILRTCLNNNAISGNVLLAVNRLIKSSPLESNDVVYGKMRDILDNCSNDIKSSENFLYDFIALSEGPKDFFKSKSDVVGKMLTTYINGDHQDELKFARIIQGAAQNNLLGENHRQVVLHKITCCLEKNLEQSETRSAVIKAVADLANYGWFNSGDDESKVILDIFERLATSCPNIQNDSLNVARIISELAERGLLNDYLETSHNGNFGQNLMFFMNICSNDVEVASHIAKAIACLLEKDSGNNSKNFFQLVKDNVSTFINILSKCSQDPQSLQNVSNSMKYIVECLAGIENKDTLAKIMQQKSTDCLTNARSEEQIIDILTLCTVDDKMKAVTIDCFQALFDSYFKENVSKEIALKILDLLGNLATYGGRDESYIKSRIANIFVYLVKKFEYEFPKDKMVKIMFELGEGNSKIRRRFLEILKELILNRGKLDEYFVPEDRRTENDDDCEGKILKMLDTYYGNAQASVVEIAGHILINNKLDDNAVRRSRVFKVLVNSYPEQGNEKSRVPAVRYLLLFLEKYDVPNPDSVEDIKKTLSFCATCPGARKNVVACIDKLVEKGNMEKADADNFKKQLLLQFI